jgi:RNA polymerase sigma-70 factor (sigma-E family)
MRQSVVESDSDAVIGEASPARSELSFIELYHECFGSMVRLAFVLTGSSALAEDLVQDVFVKVHAKWSRVHEPRAYLKRAVVNACRSAQRRERRERSHIVELVEPSVELGGDELSDALARLPHRQRAAIVLRFYEGMPDAEVAAALDCRVGTVASLVHRGLAELRKVIER